MAKQSLKQQAAAKVDTPKFQVELSQDVGPFKSGEFLTKNEHIAVAFRLLLNEGEADADKTKLTDEQIIQSVKNTDVTGLSAEDATVARLGALVNLSSTEDTPLLDATNPIGRGATAAEAIKYGHMLDDAFVATVDKGVEGGKDYDAAPILVEDDMTNRIFRNVKTEDGTPVMRTWPMIGTRRQGGKNDTIPTGMTAEQWNKANTPVDFYLTKDSVTGDDIKGRWLNDFVSAIPKVSKLINDKKLLRSMARGEEPVGLPAHLAKLKGDANGIKGALQDVSADISGFVNRIGRAIQYYQAKEIIRSEFPDVAVRLVDGITVEQSARRALPVQLLQLVRTKDAATGETIVERTPAPPISLTKFINLNWSRAKSSGSSTAALLQSNARGTKKKTGAIQLEKLPKVANTHMLADYCQQAFMYIDGDGAQDMLNKALATPDGGRIASAVVGMFDSLRRFGEDANWRAVADAYDRAQNTAVAAAAQATTTAVPSSTGGGTVNVPKVAA